MNLRTHMLDLTPAGLHLDVAPGTPFTAESAAARLGQPEAVELAFKVLEHLAANPETKVTKNLKSPWWESTYVYQG